MNISIAKTEKEGEKGTRRDILGGAICTVPVPVHKLNLDLPNLPLGQDLAPLGLNDLQTSIECDMRHRPLAPPPHHVQIAHVHLKLQSVHLCLHRLHVCRLYCKHSMQHQEQCSCLCQSELASYKEEKHFGGRWSACR